MSFEEIQVAFDLASAKPVQGFDLASARPVSEEEEFEFRARAEREAAAKKRVDPQRPPQAEEDPTSALNLLGAATEPMMSMVSSAIATPTGDIAGLGASALRKLGITDANPAEIMKKVKEAMTYEPRTTGAKNGMLPLQKVGEIVANQQKQEDADPWNRQRLNNRGVLPKPTPTGEVIGTTISDLAQMGLGGKAGARLAETPGVLRPKTVNPTIRELADQGVVTTPGQRAGPKSVVNALEQKASKLPVGGTAIKNARREAVTQWSRAQLDDAMKDAGAPPVPKGAIDRDAHFHAYTELKKRYDSLLPRMKGDLDSVGQPALPASGARPATAPTSFRQDLMKIRQMAAAPDNGIRPTEKRHLLSIIDNEVIGRFTQHGKASGETLGDIKDVIDKERKGYQSGNNSERKVAAALDSVEQSLNQMLRRENPAMGAQLNAIDKAYAKFQTALLASKYAGKEARGTFTPNQHLRAIESKDPTKNKRAFLTGKAPGQAKTQRAADVLGETQPDSGTPAGEQFMQMLKNPWNAAGLPAATLAPLIYNQRVLKMLQNRSLKGSNRPARNTGAILGAGAAQQATEPTVRQLLQGGP
jgi:hypothetical protein